MDLWFSESHTPDVKLSLRVKKQLFSDKSDYQQIDVLETEEFGRTLVLDGNPTSSEYGVDFVSHQWSVNQDVNLKNADKPKAYIGTTTPTSVTIAYEATDENGCKATTSRDIEIVNQKIPVIIGKNVCVNTSD